MICFPATIESVTTIHSIINVQRQPLPEIPSKLPMQDIQSARPPKQPSSAYHPPHERRTNRLKNDSKAPCRLSVTHQVDDLMYVV